MEKVSFLTFSDKNGRIGNTWESPWGDTYLYAKQTKNAEYRLTHRSYSISNHTDQDQSPTEPAKGHHKL